MAKRIKNHNGGKTYTCNGKDFSKSTIQENYQNLRRNGISGQAINKIRRDAKRVPALLFNATLSGFNLVKPFSRQMIDLLASKCNNEQVKAYIECICETYNAPQQYVKELGLIINRKANKLDKAIQCAYVDSKYVNKHYLSGVLDMLTKENQLNSKSYINDITNAKRSIAIFINFMKALYKQYLPDLISAEIFNECLIIDNKIQSFYKQQNEFCYKICANSKIKYTTLDIECATILIAHYENLLKE